MAQDTECVWGGLQMPQEGPQLLTRNEGKLNGNHHPVHSYSSFKSLLVRIISLTIKCALCLPISNKKCGKYLLVL